MAMLPTFDVEVPPLPPSITVPNPRHGNPTGGMIEEPSRIAISSAAYHTATKILENGHAEVRLRDLERSLKDLASWSSKRSSQIYTLMTELEAEEKKRRIWGPLGGGLTHQALQQATGRLRKLKEEERNAQTHMRHLEEVVTYLKCHLKIAPSVVSTVPVSTTAPASTTLFPSTPSMSEPTSGLATKKRNSYKFIIDI